MFCCIDFFSTAVLCRVTFRDDLVVVWDFSVHGLYRKLKHEWKKLNTLWVMSGLQSAEKHRLTWLNSDMNYLLRLCENPLSSQDELWTPGETLSSTWRVNKPVTEWATGRGAGVCVCVCVCVCACVCWGDHLLIKELCLLANSPLLLLTLICIT